MPRTVPEQTQYSALSAILPSVQLNFHWAIAFQFHVIVFENCAHFIDDTDELFDL
jgi:hypothetical protein